MDIIGKCYSCILLLGYDIGFDLKTCSKVENSFKGLYFVLPTIIVLAPQAKEPMWRFDQPTNMSIQNIHSGALKMTPGSREPSVSWTSA